MSIALRTDIILDVVRAADPNRAAATTRELESLSAQSAGPSFSSHLGSLAERAPQDRALIERTDALNTKVTGNSAAFVNGANRAATGAISAPQPDTAGALGALLVQKMIEQMMPKASATNFGAGSAGSIWRSALAEKLSLSIAPSIFNAQSLKLPIAQGVDGISTRGAA